MHYNFLVSEGLQGTYMNALNPLNSKLMTLTPRGGLWTFSAILALCAVRRITTCPPRFSDLAPSLSMTYSFYLWNLFHTCSVRNFVLFQFIFCFESRIALRTWKEFQSCMNKLMFSQGWFCSKCFWAKSTFFRLFLEVYQHMQLKIESLLKCLIVAQTAEKVLFGLDVRFVHVIPQFCRWFKAYN